MNHSRKVVAVSGCFNPLTVGHINLLEAAKELGSHTVVIINNDVSTRALKGYLFMPIEHRVRILSSLRTVDEIIVSLTDDVTIEKTLRYIKPDVFAVGGSSIPLVEKDVCSQIGCEVVYNVGGTKVSSSTSLARQGLQASFWPERCDG